MSNFVDNGEYYLVARYIDSGEVKQLPILKKWYLGNDSEEKQYRVDISAIDLITTQFNSKEQLIDRLFERNYINSKNVDLYITHMNKFKEKYYINEYELIYNSNDRVTDIIELAKLRLNNQPIKTNNKEANSIMNKYISKCYSNYSFYAFMTSPWSKEDKYLMEKTMQDHKKGKVDHSLKYRLEAKMTSYQSLRNVISMWNIYDKLVSKYDNSNLSKTELGRQLIKEYTNMLDENKDRKNAHDDLIIKSNKNYVQGQISMNEYLKEKEESIYGSEFDEMIEETRRIKKEPFDSLELQALEKQYGRKYVGEHLNMELIQSLNSTDKYRVGLIDYIAYKNILYDEEMKKK